MSDFINTIDILGDEAVIDSIINRTITEFKDDRMSFVGEYAFSECLLTLIDIPNATYIAQRAFLNCYELASVSIPNVNVIYDNAFKGCEALTSIVLPSVYNILTGAFEDCTSLTTVDIHTVCSIKTKNFYNCESLNTLIIRGTSGVPEMPYADCLGNTPIANNRGYIYVPRALVDSYKAANNWSVYAGTNQIVALEDYTLDGTVMGEWQSKKLR